MPEQDQERLIGKIEVTPSSDEAIIASLKETRKRLTDVSDKIIDGEIYKPLSVTSNAVDNSAVQTKVKIIDISSLRPTDSYSGVRIRSDRLAKKGA